MEKGTLSFTSTQNKEETSFFERQKVDALNDVRTSTERLVLYC